MTLNRHAVTVLRSPIPGVYSTETRSAHHFDKHWHDVFGFGLLQAGAQQWSSGRGPVEAFAGQVICTNPGEVHDGRPIGAITRRWRIVSIDATTMASFVGLPPGSFEIAEPVIHDPLLREAMRAVFAVLDESGLIPDGDAADSLASEEALTRSCTLLVSRHGDRPLRRHEPRQDLTRVRERLGQLGGVAPTLDELARVAGLSRYQVLRQFERAYGLTPHAWLLQLRAERARLLIREGRRLVDVAALAGFADQSHMTRVFVRCYGYTPGVWKRAHSMQ